MFKGIIMIKKIKVTLLLATIALVSFLGANDSNANEEYLLSSEDILKIIVFGSEELSGQYVIDQDGNITIPLLGDVKAAGITKTQLDKKITKQLIKSSYFVKPNITIDIIDKKPFYILGEVKNPGQYQYVSSLDVFKAVAIAGGFTPRAVKNKVIIIREIDGKKVRIKAGEDAQILPGDSIKVKQRFF